MATAAIRVEGLDELRRDLRRAKNQGLNDAMKEIHLELAREVVAKALPNVPVKSGRLKASVRAAGTVRDAIGRVGGASTVYAPLIHWGGRGIKSRPFLREAAESIERDLTERYDQQVSEMLSRVIGRS